MELLERASTVFMRYGIKSVTMDDLSRELGVSKKTLYKHFVDKHQLVQIIIQSKIEMDKQACIMCMKDAENAIDALVNISRFVIEQITNVNPSVFIDLRKHYPEAWRLLDNHKWEFVLENIHNNINRGIQENLYRENLNPAMIARYYVASLEVILDGEVYPWPEYKPDKVIAEILRFHIRGLANDNGIAYLKKTFNSEMYE